MEKNGKRGNSRNVRERWETQACAMGAIVCEKTRGYIFLILNACLIACYA